MSKASDLHRLARLSRPLLQQVEQAVETMLHGSGITVRMRAVMEVLEEHGALSVPDVGRTLGIQRQYVQIMMNEVEKGGFVQRLENPAHRRSALFELSENGAAVIKAVRKAELSVMEGFARNLRAGDIDTALEITDQLIEQFKLLNKDLSA